MNSHLKSSFQQVMPRVGSCIVSVIFLGLGLMWAASDPLGMVLRPGTEALLVRDGESRALRMAEVLYPGDTVIAGKGQVDFLFCPANELVLLKPGAKVELSLDAVNLLEGDGLERREAKRCSLPRVALGTESLERVGGMRARGFAPIEIFLGGNISSSRPTFEWLPVDAKAMYRLALKDDFGQELWSETTQESRMLYPESREALEPGGYLWEISAEVDGETMAQQAARFTVKPDEELNQMLSDQELDVVLQATLLENAGYYAEAAAFFREFRKDSPDDERLTRHLIWLYWNSGLITAASAERARLEELNQHQ